MTIPDPTPPASPGEVEFLDGAFHVAAEAIAPGLGVPAAQVPALLRAGEITSLCEKGLEEDAGCYRLTFFHGNRRLRLLVDDHGRIFRRGLIDFGDHPLPPAARRSGG